MKRGFRVNIHAILYTYIWKAVSPVNHKCLCSRIILAISQTLLILNMNGFRLANRFAHKHKHTRTHWKSNKSFFIAIGSQLLKCNWKLNLKNQQFSRVFIFIRIRSHCKYIKYSSHISNNWLIGQFTNSTVRYHFSVLMIKYVERHWTNEIQYKIRYSLYPTNSIHF